jgi:hypothetical protein
MFLRKVKHSEPFPAIIYLPNFKLRTLVANSLNRLVYGGSNEHFIGPQSSKSSRPVKLSTKARTQGEAVRPTRITEIRVSSFDKPQRKNSEMKRLTAMIRAWRCRFSMAGSPKNVCRGGDTRTRKAKVDIAKRENQIVELRLRNISFAAIGRAVGVSKTAAIKAFYKALRRNTDEDISTHHRS